MRRATLVAAVAVSAVITLAPRATAADAATISAVGWWTSVPVTSAPEGGIAVGRGGSGPITVAAIRFSVGEEPPTSAMITLTEADAVGADVATIAVCPTPNAWEPVAAGSMDDAPQPECDRGSVDLERAADGTWTGDVASLLEAGQPSLMVVPAEAAEGAPAAPFQLSFEPPALKATAPPASLDDDAVSPSPSPTTATRPAPTPASRPVFNPPPPPSASNTPTTTAPIPEPVTDEVAIGPAVTIPTSAAGAGAIAEDRPWGQALFFLVVSAAAGVAAAIGRRQLRLRRT